MNLRAFRFPFLRAAPLLLAAALLPASAHAGWQRDETTIAWMDGTNAVWKFSFDPKKGKPFFHPVTAGGHALTNFKPADHPWHYGLWFSWKYINHANYWEEDRKTGEAAGKTKWTTPQIDARPDGSATIQMHLDYVNPSNRVDLTESRTIKISALAADGSYTIEWRGQFTAGEAGAVLDRTPMPGEKGGAVNGGYAGLGLRLISKPAVMTTLSSMGPVTKFEHDRARPAAPAVACNFTEDGNDLGGIAIFSDPVNAGENAPWYLINSDLMRFACAAILAPKIRTLKPAEAMELHYVLAIHPKAWTVESLNATAPHWTK